MDVCQIVWNKILFSNANMLKGEKTCMLVCIHANVNKNRINELNKALNQWGKLWSKKLSLHVNKGDAC